MPISLTLSLDSHKNQYLVTTVGKLIFNEILPDSFPYINDGTKENIEGITPSKYFLEKGKNVKLCLQIVGFIWTNSKLWLLKYYF